MLRRKHDIKGRDDMSATGRCLCGNIEYSLSQEVVSPDVCHCDNCQRQAGASNTASVTSGTQDVTDNLQPKCHGWMSSRHAWASLTDGAPQYAMYPGLQPESV